MQFIYTLFDCTLALFGLYTVESLFSFGVACSSSLSLNRFCGISLVRGTAKTSFPYVCIPIRLSTCVHFEMHVRVFISIYQMYEKCREKKYVFRFFFSLKM